MRSLPRLALVACVGLSGWIGWLAYEGWRYRVDLAEAGRDMERGRFASARVRLAGLLARWPRQAEVAFKLGLCEQATGHPDAAIAAWARVPPGRPESGKAALAKGRLVYSRGRFAEAEADLERALREPGPHRPEARTVLGQLYRYQGRLGDVGRLLRAGFEESPRPAEVLREHWLLAAETIPIERVRGVLEWASKLAPDDDRVWLSWANLATRSGRHDEAAGWLARCRERRPGDPPIWEARLSLARATEDLPEVRLAMARLHADRFRPSEVAEWRAWFATLRGDVEAERAALSDLLALDPGDGRALVRLADIATQSGQTELAQGLRRRKAGLDTSWETYRAVVAKGDLARSGELAQIALSLGRYFEARGWAKLAFERDRGDARSRNLLARRWDLIAPENPAGLTLADLLPETLSPATYARHSATEGAIPRFDDEAEAAGLRFTYDNGRSTVRQLPETMSGGVGLLDYDGDGWLDVYAVQGGPFPPDPAHPSRGDRLFRNKGDGTFEDVTEVAGLAGYRGYGLGVTVGDFDNDGHPDLFVTRWRSYALYRNRGDGTFEDATESAGLSGDRDWPTSAAFADLDNDGDLDLYVCHYLEWDSENPKLCRNSETQAYSYCHPRSLPALPDHLFRNEGGHFVDVTAEAGIVDRDGRGLGVVAADLDGDGRVDLFVANDSTANYFFRNLGGLQFREQALESGLATNAAGGYMAGMGVACGDLDGDGRVDLAVTNFYAESTTFYQNLGGGLFSDRTAAIGLAEPSRFRLGFGIAMLDANDDGRLDLLSANGHVNDLRPSFAYAMPLQLLIGTEGGRLLDVTAKAGPALELPRVGRGLAVGDLDNDGRADALALSQMEPLTYLHNRTPEARHFLTLRLEGTASSRDAVGAVVTVVAGGRRQVAQRFGGGSYQSAGDSRLHFGLGGSDRVESVEVRWPSGRSDRYVGMKADSGYLIREGEPEPRPLAGFGRG